jgi:anaerobic selenocysteine-containing dehydrogenase
MECPGSDKDPVEGTIEMLWDFDTRGECPVCHHRCGLMLDVDRGKEVIKPHEA